jgi:hypothetical protein
MEELESEDEIVLLKTDGTIARNDYAYLTICNGLKAKKQEIDNIQQMLISI